MIFMPYSPRWLVHHGHEEEAKKTLALLRKTTDDDGALELEYLEIKSQSLFEKRATARDFPHLKNLNSINIIKLQFLAIFSLFKTMPMFRRVIV